VTDTRVARDAEQTLVRAIGPWALGANAINLTIGAGIFALPAVIAAMLGPAAVLAYLICGVLILLVLTCYVEVGTQVTRSGGAVAYVEEAFGPLAGFLAWALYSIGFCGASSAAIAHVLLDTVATAVPVLAGGPARVVGLVLLFGGLATVNVVGVRQGTRVSIATTVAKLLPLLLLLVLGAFAVRGSNLVWSGWPSMSELGAGTLVIFFAFTGAEGALAPSGEIRDPSRTVPRGMLGGAVAVVLLYLGLQLVAQGVLGGELARGTSTPLVDVAQRLAGALGRGLVVACTAVAIFGCIAADLICNPRAFLAAAESGALPRVFRLIHPRYNTPWFSIVAYAAIVLALSLSGGFRAMAVLASMAVLLVYLGVSLAALRLRYTRPQAPGTFRAPGGPTVALLASATVVWVLAQSTRREVVAIAILVGASTLYYMIRRQVVAVPAVADG